MTVVSRSTRYLLLGLSTAAVTVVLAAVFAYTGGQIVDVTSLSRRAGVVLAMLAVTAVVGWVAIGSRQRSWGRGALYVAECMSGAWLIAGIWLVFSGTPSAAGVIAVGVVSLPGIAAGGFLLTHFPRRGLRQ